MHPKWSRFNVTLAAGVVAVIVGVFPGLCSKFLDVAALYGLLLCPMGGVIFVDHHVARKCGLLDFYAERAGLRYWWPPLAAWGLALVACVVMNQFFDVQIFFLGLPAWMAAGLLYLVLSRMAQDRALVERIRR